MSTTFEPTARTKVRRNPVRGVYDREVVDSIINEGLICQVAFVHKGEPCVIPTAYARDESWLYVHGARANRTLNSICGQLACVSITLVDGLVLSRSAFHHSANYRSVMIYGIGEEVTSADQKMEAMRLLIEHVVPGRWEDSRQPNEKELNATLIVRIPLEECSAKVRSGPPVDDEEDLTWPCWAGVLPVELDWQDPLVDETCDRPAPDYLKGYRR